MRYRWIVRALFLVVVGPGLAVTPSGCGDTASQVTLIKVEAAGAAEGEITPLERGKIRRQVLSAAEKAIGAWVKDDASEMEVYFAEQYLDYYRGLREKNESQGKTRVRQHESAEMNVTDMNATGTEVLVEYSFVDKSYYASADGQPVGEPDGSETLVQIRMELAADQWKVMNMIGGKALE